jgi:hypothetical protein
MSKPANLESMYAENSAAVATMTAAAGTKRKVTKEDVKRACKVLIRDLDSLPTWTNEGVTIMTNNLNQAAINLQKLVAKALSGSSNSERKINGGLIIPLMMLDFTEKPFIAEFLAKEDWDTKYNPDDRKLLHDMLEKLDTKIAGGRRRSKKQKKQRRRTRRQK